MSSTKSNPKEARVLKTTADPQLRGEGIQTENKSNAPEGRGRPTINPRSTSLGPGFVGGSISRPHPAIIGKEQKQPQCRRSCLQNQENLRQTHKRDVERHHRRYLDELGKALRERDRLSEDVELRIQGIMEDEKFLHQHSCHFRNLEAKNTELSMALTANQATVKELQRDLATIRHGHGPVNDEQYYRDQLSSVHRKIENWVNKFTREQQMVPWTDDQSLVFITALCATGGAGETTSQELRKWQALNSVPDLRSQRVLFRHAVAACLFDMVFAFFAVGMDKITAHALSEFQHNMFHDACKSGNIFKVDPDNLEGNIDKMLTIRKELGKASLQSPEVVEKFQVETSRRLVEILSSLVPPESIKMTDAETIVKSAIEIRNELTVEHGCYRFVFAFTGEKAYQSEDWFECLNESEEELKLCCFPALLKMVQKEGCEEEAVEIVVQRAKLDCLHVFNHIPA